MKSYFNVTLVMQVCLVISLYYQNHLRKMFAFNTRIFLTKPLGLALCDETIERIGYQYRCIMYMRYSLNQECAGESSDQHLSLIDFQASQEAGHKGLRWSFPQTEPLLRGSLLLYGGLWRGFIFVLAMVPFLSIIRTTSINSVSDNL